MKVDIPAARLTILVGSRDIWRHKPLSDEIVRRAHAAGLNGASTFHGVEGFGASSTIHSTRHFSWGDGVPVAIVIVDDERKVRSFLCTLDELMTEGVVTIDNCELLRYYREGRSRCTA